MKVVPVEGIEPPLLAEHDFESCASTSSATRASVVTYIQDSRSRQNENGCLASTLKLGTLVYSPTSGEDCMHEPVALKRTWGEPFRDGPAAAAFTIFIIALATLLGAWFFQFVLGYPPCPLCLDQRIQRE